MSSFGTEVAAFYERRIRVTGDTPIEFLAMASPGLCLIITNEVVFRRRMLASLAMLEVTWQTDAVPNYSPQISIFANGPKHGLLRDLLALDGSFEPYSVEIANEKQFGIEPVSLDSLSILALAGGITPSAESQSNDNAGDEGRFNPLYFNSKAEAFRSILTSIESAQAGSIVFVENFHLLTLTPEYTPLTALLHLRNKAHEGGVTLYMGAACKPGLAPFDRGSGTTPPPPSLALADSLAGAETVADCIIHLEGVQDDNLLYSMSRFDFIGTHLGTF